jgi:hypothetical protein
MNDYEDSNSDKTTSSAADSSVPVHKASDYDGAETTSSEAEVRTTTELPANSREARLLALYVAAQRIAYAASESYLKGLEPGTQTYIILNLGIRDSSPTTGASHGLEVEAGAGAEAGADIGAFIDIIPLEPNERTLLLQCIRESIDRIERPRDPGAHYRRTTKRYTKLLNLLVKMDI